MIGDAEVRRLAHRTGVEPRVIDLDYVLSWALHGLASDPDLRARLVFKGGTCLRKCYFPGYRFSEDLDFTATGPFEPDAFERAVREAFRSAQDKSGIDFAAQEPRMEILDDEYGSESVQRLHGEVMSAAAAGPEALANVARSAHERLEQALPPEARPAFREWVEEHHAQMTERMQGGAMHRQMHGQP